MFEVKGIQALGQIVSYLKGLPLPKKIILGVAMLGTFGSLLIVILWSSGTDQSVLYANLNPEDASAIVARLKEQKIPYELAAGGKTILIPKEALYETRMDLAAQGLPQGGGVGLEIFDKTKLGMTEFVQNVNYQRAIQGELARTINGFNEVESSRVHIVLPTRSLFLEKEEKATASVVLKIKPGRSLTQEQIRGIVHLVSASVSGLSPESVTVVDHYGKILSKNRDDGGSGQLTLEQLDIQERHEQSVQHRIKTMLEGVLGPGKAIVRASCFIDFGRQEKTSEKYLPENKVVRSEQIHNSVMGGGDKASVGVPGVVSNHSEDQKDLPTSQAGQGFKGSSKEERTVNYEIGKEVSRTLDPVARLGRVSVAVVVDGTYKLEKPEGGEKDKDADGKGGIKYVPRTEAEIEKLSELVKSAINFDPSRGDKVSVVNIAFETTGSQDGTEGSWVDRWLSPLLNHPAAVKQGFMAVFMLLVFFFGIRPLLKWVMKGTGPQGELALELPRTVAEIEQDYAGEPDLLPFRDRALDLISKDKEASLRLMKEWLKESQAAQPGKP